MSTSLYAPFRSLGHVSTDVPFSLLAHSTQASAILGPNASQKSSQVILTSLGIGWALWTTDSLRLLYVGPLTPCPITWLNIHPTGLILASAGENIYVYKRTKLTMVLRTKAHSDPTASNTGIASENHDSPDWIAGFKTTNSKQSSNTIREFLTYGNQVVGLSTCGRTIWVWHLDSPQELHLTIELPPTFGAASTLIHPATYVNKIVVASEQGGLAIYNVQLGALIHMFQPTLFSRPTKSRSKGVNVPITYMAQGPAVDILAVGFADGWCSLVDIRFGEEILAVKMGSDSPDDPNESITGIAFRSDSDCQLLVTSSSQGHLAIWNMNQSGQLLHILREAHDSAVSGVQFLPGQPIMMTASGDNSIKLWLFETPTGLPRLLSQRSGHQKPPQLIRYYGDDGKTIISAGKDGTIRSTSVVRDSRSFEISQGSLAKKASQLATPVSSLRLPTVTGLSYSTSRAKDWDDLLTCHEGHPEAKSWSVQNKRRGKHSFSLTSHTSFKLAPPEEVTRCVCVTACGNYALSGTHGTGRIGMWNMQSGMKRREFLIPSSSKVRATKTDSKVMGIATDVLNRLVIVLTHPGCIYFYDFMTAKLSHTIVLPCSASTMLLQRDNGLLAIACEDLRIRIMDIETRRTVRELGPLPKPVLDMVFSPDSRWIVVTSADSVIRTYDLPTGSLIDAFRTHSVATSITFSPTGDFLASAHTDSVGVFLWANRAQFAEVSYKSITKDADIPILETPLFEGVEDQTTSLLESNLRSGTWQEDGLEEEVLSLIPDSSSDGSITLSLMPKSKWQSLLNLEIIKARNKPKDPPKATEAAPFFLPTLSTNGRRGELAGSSGETNSTTQADSGSKKRKFDLGDSALVESEFTRRLMKDETDENYEDFFGYVRNLSPSALDIELRSITTDDQMKALLRALTARLTKGKEFEMIQAILSVFLKIHGQEIIATEEDLPGDGDLLAYAQEASTSKLKRLVDYGIGVSAFVRGATGVV
ncbi:Utp21 specific WD40 associated putative domain-containing protein [Melampsora americana]|nr:Utp21 specific WD40 associated putative domain-containing protein [Melampsora americana]